MRTARTWIPLIAAALVLGACASQKEPAEKAVAAVEASLSDVRADAEKYAADDLKAADEALGKLKAKLASQDYKSVVMEAPMVTSTINTLKETVATRKADAEAVLAAAQTEWNDLTAKVPPMVDSLQKSVDGFAKTHKLPKGMDKAGFEAAKTSLEDVKNSWTQAGQQFASGQAAEAVRTARTVKAKAEDLMTKLGLTPPAA